MAFIAGSRFHYGSQWYTIETLALCLAMTLQDALGAHEVEGQTLSRRSLSISRWRLSQSLKIKHGNSISPLLFKDWALLFCSSTGLQTE